MPAMKFSIIVPVYNRIDEVADLLESLSRQTVNNFELVLVEDGSTQPCEDVVKLYEAKFPIQYYYKENEGRSIARNYGMERAKGDYFIFFDSDCVVPEDYFEKLQKQYEEKPVDCFGGPDAAHDSFSTTQKAINYSMTSFLTTGGIRGGKISLEKFTPRTFNMGFARKVYEKVGGFREMFSEDIDMSTRIRNAGFSISLYPDQYVYHKRRVDFKKFFRQVYVFGMSRITLKLLYPGSMKAVHFLPALFVLGSIALIVLSIFVSPYWILPLVAYLLAIFVAAFCSTKSFVIALKAVPASIIQLTGYGLGFIKAYITKIIFGRGRNVEEEILIRKGK
ncbi:MAG: glycosyltransferase [Muribaculaceae bacterium]|nr:glycosyltransferase [Muribaculaceae bacterium]MDE7369149.1 glycosyltransferase [Muribaculaceae bacterium]